LKKEVLHLTEEQLETPYRQDGWTSNSSFIIADSHMNCFIRIKWALTEENPTIKFYHEDRWAELHDNLTMPVQPTLSFLIALSFAYLMTSLSNEDLEKHLYILRTTQHLNQGNNRDLCLAWNHHLAHITELKSKKGW
jgi:hypothetical protein